MNKQRIIYIAGYGRSGSTLLDVILSNCEEIVGVGELIFLFDEYKNNSNLSPFWKEIVGKLISNVNDKSLDEIEQLSWDVQNHLKNSSKMDKEEYKKIWESVFNQLFESFPDKIILDSSKSSRLTFHRPLLLKEMGYDLKVIHLVRDPRAVMYSVAKGSNRLLEKGENPKLFGGGYRGLFSWIYVNMLANSYYKKFDKSDIILVRYEDIVEKPKKTIHNLMKFLDLEFPDLNALEKGEFELNPGIGISGNRMRRESGKITLAKDYTWKKKLPFFKKVIANIVAFPLMRRFDYF